MRIAFLLGLLLGGCASVPAPVAEAQKTLEALCAVYKTNRPAVVAARAWIVANADKVPPAVLDDLQRIDAALPELDARGKQVCEIARAGELLKGNVSRDELVASLIRFLGVALQMKQSGVI